MVIKSVTRGSLQTVGIVCILIFFWYSIRVHISNTDISQKPLKDSASRVTRSPSEVTQHLLGKLNRTLQVQSQASSSKPSFTTCEQFPDTQDILLVMKTGATEAYEKLPIHFLTTLKCLNDSIIFSDMDMQMGNHHIIDVLKDIDETEMHGNEQFAFYQQLQQYKRLGLDPLDLKDHMRSWNLDKYKFVPMLKKAWEYRQNAKWYVFVEADTAINWSNMRSFLNILNPEEPLYIGSPTYLSGIEMAHGGTGYIISGAAMKKAVGSKPDIQELYGAEVKNFCCGDRMPAKILLDEGINLTKTWPMFNGETLLSLAYGDKQWCQPVITMHHMAPFQISQFWSFEQNWKASRQERPILWMDVYDRFVHPNLKEEEQEDWTNFATDLVFKSNEEKFEQFDELSPERASIQSPDLCKRLCEYYPECLSWQYHDETCSLGRTFKLGQSMSDDAGEEWTSGWHLERIARFRERMDNCSHGPDWTYAKAKLLPWLST